MVEFALAILFACLGGESPRQSAPDQQVQAWYPLPPADVCRAMWNAANRDCNEIRDQLARTDSFFSGFQRQQLEPFHAEARRIERAWFVAMLLQRGEPWVVAIQDQYAEELRALLGEADFLQGKMPWPLSMRR